MDFSANDNINVFFNKSLPLYPPSLSPLFSSCLPSRYLHTQVHAHMYLHSGFIFYKFSCSPTSSLSAVNKQWRYMVQQAEAPADATGDSLPIRSGCGINAWPASGLPFSVLVDMYYLEPFQDKNHLRPD